MWAGSLSLLLLLQGAITLVDSATVMSVGLGAEWMKIAVVTPGIPMEIALNGESKRKTAVAVALTENGERSFGGDALNICVKHPKSCYVYILELLGKKIDHPQVELFKRRFPHHELKAHPERGTVLFQHDAETAYSPEELLAMILQHAAKIAADFSEQKVYDAVITVPVYFGQAERRALLEAVELAGLNCLQLMSEPMAVALNYGMFRRKEVKKEAKYFMFYDMGAHDTTVAIVSYQEVKTYDRGYSQTHPQAQILGVGYDRNLGGLDLQIVLRDFLAKKFNEMGKTKTDVTTVPRAMGKIFKEAGRVKNILSANSHSFAQIENVMEEIDLRQRINRDTFLELTEGFFSHVTGPVRMALETWGGTMDEIEEVILVGGGTRVPRVQEELLKFFEETDVGGRRKRELGKGLNTDEAAAMGAVFKAADLSAGFKTKKFLTKEALIFPVSVQDDKQLDGSHTLFARMNPFPTKKVVTFDEKQTGDGDFGVKLELSKKEMEHLTEDEISNIGSNQLYNLKVSGVSEVIAKHSGVARKGVRAHFHLDDSGLVNVTSVEAAFERTVSVEEQEAVEKKKEEEEEAAEKAAEGEGVLDKLGDTISNFFGGDKEEAEKKQKEAKKEREKKKKENEKKKKEREKKKKNAPPKKPKVEHIAEPLRFTFEVAAEDLPRLPEATVSEYRAKLEALKERDDAKRLYETALNKLETLVIDVKEKLGQEDGGLWQTSVSPEERTKISEKCGGISDWIDEEVSPATLPKELEERLQELVDMVAPWFARVREHTDRPEVMGALHTMITNAENFSKQARNISDEGEYFFNEKELDEFADMVEGIKRWKEEGEEVQEARKNYEIPHLRTSEIADKGVSLDTELKRILSAATLQMGEHKKERKKIRAEEDKIFKEELLKAKEEIRVRREQLKNKGKPEEAAPSMADAIAKEYERLSKSQGGDPSFAESMAAEYRKYQEEHGITDDELEENGTPVDEDEFSPDEKVPPVAEDDTSAEAAREPKSEL